MDNKKFEKLLSEIRLIIKDSDSKKNVIKLYYIIGKILIDNQNKSLSKEKLLINISSELGKGYGKANLSDMRRLYNIYKNRPEQFALSQEIGWSHNRTLLNDGIEPELRTELLQYAINNKVSAEKLEIKMAKIN